MNPWFQQQSQILYRPLCSLGPWILGARIALGLDRKPNLFVEERIFGGGMQTEVVGILAIVIAHLAIALLFLFFLFRRQRKVQSALRASEARFRDLAYSLSDWVYETDERLHITYCSDSVRSILGYSPQEILGHSPVDFLPEQEKPRIQNTLLALAKNPEPFKGVETWVICKDGQRVCLLVNGTPFLGPRGEFRGYRGANQNITERKKIEEALQQSESLNRSLLESLPQNVFAKDIEGRFTYANQHYCQTQRKTFQEILGKSDWDLHPADVAQKYRLDDQKVIESGQVTELVEEHHPLGQEKFYVQVIKAPIRNRFGNISGVLGIFWDITEKQRMETAIRKLNRALRTISECNQALMRATDEASLYGQICHLMVEAGGYLFAWIGTVTEGRQPILHPAARYGKGDFYLVPIPISGSSILIGGEPAQAAVFHRNTAIVQDVRLIPATASWRTEALRCGFASVVALSLCFDGECFGSLNVYASECHAFDPAEISLLEELAGDLAFGIYALRTRDERRHAEAALRESEERLRTLINAMPDGVCFKDGEGRWLEANHFQIDLFQLAGTDYRGKKDAELAIFAPFYREAFLGCTLTDELAWKTGEVRRAEETLPRPNGENLVFDIIKAPTFYPDGQRKGLVVVGRDITKRKQAEEALRQSEQRYRTLFEQANDAIFLEGRNGQIEDVNQRACKLLGYAQGDLIGRRISDLLVPQVRQTSPFGPRCDSNSDSKPFETVGIRQDGRRVPVEVTHTTLSDRLTLFIARDITERKRAEEHLQQVNRELSQAYDATLRGWSRALELRERETAGHSQRVVEMTLRIARAFGLSEEELVHVRRGVLLHDIGKMGIPDSILLKAGPLTSEEWDIMHRHPGVAYELLADISFLRPALDIPYCHHEHWDGNGYPRGLKGEQIPLAARIFAVVDVWDALTSQRPYHTAWEAEKVRQLLRQQAGRHFDPQVVEMFFRLGAS